MTELNGLAAGRMRGTLEHNAAMSGYTSWRAGGPADRLYKPADLDDLCAYLKTLPADEPVNFIGLGSNLLVRDGGLRGTVIFMHGALKQLRFEERRTAGRESGAESPSPCRPKAGIAPPRGAAESLARSAYESGVPPAGEASGFCERGGGFSRFGVVYAEAGVASPKVARFAANNDLTGAEFLAGIPGTVGGALAMNAGCYGHETWSYVSQVLTVDQQGNTHKRSPREFQVAYRHVEATGQRKEWFVAVWLLFPRGDGEAGRAEIKRLLDRRIATQPLDLPNAGSVFRNPPGDYAARLIESCGMKGARLGDAQVSEKHANFIVNLNKATATEIETLIEMVQEKVRAKSGVELVREVRILGEPVAQAYPQGVGRGCNAAENPAATSTLSSPASVKPAGEDACVTGGGA